MITYRDVTKLMDGYGYMESSRSTVQGEVFSVSFHPKDFMNDYNYEVTVGLDNEDFKFFYLVPKSVVKVTLGPAGPVTNEAHFNKMKDKFLEVIGVLDAKFGGQE